MLYIEDNLPNLQLVERVLSRRPGTKLIPAMRPQLGLDLAEHHHPDLVLLDLQLPDLPGIEVLRRLRTNPNTTDVPVVVLSADARPSLITQLLAEGARAFLTKPLDVNELLALLDTIAAEHQQARSASTSLADETAETSGAARLSARRPTGQGPGLLGPAPGHAGDPAVAGDQPPS